MTTPSAKPEPLHEFNSSVFVFTKRPAGGTFSDAGATSIHLRAKSFRHAHQIAFKRRLRLDGKLVK